VIIWHGGFPAARTPKQAARVVDGVVTCITLPGTGMLLCHRGVTHCNPRREGVLAHRIARFPLHKAGSPG